ncbi:MAG: hypothetical protein AAGC54_06300, partial [Cyanobacteria bacterium P01_F01_bin.4]
FMFSAATMSLYGGALSDPDGFTAVAGELDSNLILFSVALIFLVFGWFLTESKYKGSARK